MNVEGTIGYVIGSLLFMLTLFIDLEIDEWKERRRDKESNINVKK